MDEHQRRVHRGRLIQATQDSMLTNQYTENGTRKQRKGTSSFSHDEPNSSYMACKGKPDLGPSLQSTADSYVTVASGIQESDSNQDF